MNKKERRKKNNKLHQDLKEFGINAFQKPPIVILGDNYSSDPSTNLDNLFLINTDTQSERRTKLFYSMGAIEPDKVKVYGNKKLRQAVISVCEKARKVKFEASVEFHSSNTLEGLKNTIKNKRLDADVVFELCPVSIPLNEDQIYDLEYTMKLISAEELPHNWKAQIEFVLDVPKTEIYLLVGYDEDDLFISALPAKATSVKKAHEILRPEGLSKKAIRTGEFFLEPVEKLPTSLHDKYLERGIHDSDHIADFMVMKYDSQYVTGQIEHKRHKTVVLNTWYKVVRNNEIEAPADVVWD